MATRVYPGNQPMAFRVFGAVPGTWHGSLDNARPEFSCNNSYMASRVKEDAGAKNTSAGTIININQQGNYDTVLRQWNLGPMSAQTISGTFDLCFNQRVLWTSPLDPPTSDSVVRYKVHIAIMSGQTNTVRAVLLDNLVDSDDLNTDSGGVGEWQSLASPAALTPADCEEGDYIRIVVGYRIVSSPTPTPIYPSEPFNVDAYATEIILYSGFGATNFAGVAQADGVPGDTNVVGTTGLERAAWFEFSADLSFAADTPDPPANDECADAEEITSFPYRSPEIDTRSAASPDKNVWYRFTAPRTGTFVVMCLGSTYACGFDMMEGSDCDTAFNMFELQDGGLTDGRSISMMTVDVVEGQDYFLTIYTAGMLPSTCTTRIGGLLTFYAFFQETPQEDDLYLAAGNLISWRRDPVTRLLWPVMFSFNAEGSGSALTGVAIDYTRRPIIDNFGFGSEHTGIRILLGLHSLDDVAILDINTFEELDNIHDNFDLPLLRLHPAQMVITAEGHLYQAFFGNGYLHIEGIGTLPAMLNAVSDVPSYSGIRSLEATNGDGQGEALAEILIPDIEDQTPAAWGVTVDGSTGDLLFTLGSVYWSNVGSQYIGRFHEGVVSIFANLPATDTYLPGLRGIQWLPDGTVLVCNGSRAQRVSATGEVLVNYIPTARPEHFEVCADIKVTADGERVWVISFDFAALALFDINTGEEIDVYDTWQHPISLVQMAIYQEEGPEIPPPPPPPVTPVEEECPADILTPPPMTALQKFFKVHSQKGARRPSTATADALFGDYGGALSDTSFGQLQLGGSGFRRRPGEDLDL